MANDGTKEGGAIEQVVVDDHGVEKDSTENEITKIHLIRHFVESRDPSSKKEDDLMLRRFLRARDLDIEKASTMFLKYLKWRHSFVPNGSISLQEILNDLAHDKVFVQGHDKSGRPIAIILGARHFQNKNGLEEFKHLKGWRYSNSDVRGYISALNILQDYYPERLGKLLVVHAPYIFMKVWKMVYPVLDNKTKKKIIFVESNKLKSTLMENIEESQLPEIYGGPLPLVPVQHI
ncbi:hypothetical protein Lal_00006206 [Lupinus albus]|nr:hypothetical protein Lal_00006206 [Lupinus albus]